MVVHELVHTAGARVNTDLAASSRVVGVAISIDQGVHYSKEPIFIGDKSILEKKFTAKKTKYVRNRITNGAFPLTQRRFKRHTSAEQSNPRNRGCKRLRELGEYAPELESAAPDSYLDNIGPVTRWVTSVR